MDILSLSILGSDLYVCSADGQVKVIYLVLTANRMLTHSLQRYSDTFDCTTSWNAHSGIVLSSIIADAREYELITGGNDGAINVLPLFSSFREILTRL